MYDAFSDRNPPDPAMEQIERVERYPEQRYQRIVPTGGQEQREEIQRS